MSQIALLEELLGLLKTLNDSITPKEGNSLSNKNILGGENTTDPNKKISSSLSNPERKRTKEIATIFAKTILDYQSKSTKDTALKTSIAKVTKIKTPTFKKKEEAEKSGGFLGMLKNLLPILGGIVGIGALIAGLATDGPFKGILKLFAKGGMKMLTNGIKTLIKSITRIIALPFTAMKNMFGSVMKALTGTATKTASKASAKMATGFIGKLFSALKPMLKILKKIPIIGSIISIGFAISRFKSGDNIGGVIDVLSALVGLINIIPGGSIVAIPLSLGLDILNAWLDVQAAKPENKEGGKAGILKSMAGSIGSWIWKNSDHFPIIGGIKRWGMAYQAFKSGNIQEGIKNIGYGILSFIPGGGIIIQGIEALMGFFSSNNEQSKDLKENKSWFSGLKDWIKSKLKKLPYFLRKPLEWFGILDSEKDENIEDMIGVDSKKNINELQNKISNFWKGLGDGVTDALNFTKKIGKDTMTVLGNVGQKTFEGTKNLVKKVSNVGGKVVGSTIENTKNLITKVGNIGGISRFFGGDEKKDGGKKVSDKRKNDTTTKKSMIITKDSTHENEISKKMLHISERQLLTLTDIKNVSLEILKKIDPSGGVRVIKPSPLSQNSLQNSPQRAVVPREEISLNGNRNDYLSSPYALI